ncbi:mCG144590, partial [Mus musculus]
VVIRQSHPPHCHPLYCHPPCCRPPGSHPPHHHRHILLIFFGVVCLFVCLFFKTGFLCVALAVLELALQTSVTLNSRDSRVCLSLRSSGIKGAAPPPPGTL